MRGYEAVGGSALGPIIGFQLWGPAGATIEDSGIVDSGADYSAFPLWMMEQLGISKAECAEKKFDAAGCEGTQWIWKTEDPQLLDARILGYDLKLRAVFTDTPITLLGRSDFLGRFKIRLNERAAAFGIKAYR